MMYLVWAQLQCTGVMWGSRYSIHTRCGRSCCSVNVCDVGGGRCTMDVCGVEEVAAVYRSDVEAVGAVYMYLVWGQSL